MNSAKGTEKGTGFHGSGNRFQGEVAVFKGMVAYVPPATHTKLRPAGPLREQLPGSAVAAPGYAALPEWQNRGGGISVNDSGSNPTSEGMHLHQVPLISHPKPEPQQYRASESEGADYDFYLHGRKRFKLHDSHPSTVLQVRFPGKLEGHFELTDNFFLNL